MIQSIQRSCPSLLEPFNSISSLLRRFMKIKTVHSRDPHPPLSLFLPLALPGCSSWKTSDGRAVSPTAVQLPESSPWAISALAPFHAHRDRGPKGFCVPFQKVNIMSTAELHSSLGRDTSAWCKVWSYSPKYRFFFLPKIRSQCSGRLKYSCSPNLSSG